jgi:hypothetical protein
MGGVPSTVSLLTVLNNQSVAAEGLSFGEGGGAAPKETAVVIIKEERFRRLSEGRVPSQGSKLSFLLPEDTQTPSA